MKFKKFIIYLFAVVAGIALIDCCFGLIFNNLFFLKGNFSQQKAFRGGDGEDLIIFGASRAMHHYVPEIIYDSLGLKNYNYGRDGQNIYYHYGMLNVVLNNARIKPKYVLLELAKIDVYDTPKWNREKLSALNELYVVDDTVKSIFAIDGWKKEIGLKFSSLYRYNSTLLDKCKYMLLSNNAEENRGYSPLFKVWNKRRETVTTTPNSKLDTCKIEYLHRFIKVCRDYDVKPVFFVSPEYKKYNVEQNWITEAKEIATKNNVVFCNYHQDSLFLNHPEWFNEPVHLNNKGATIYTRHIVHKLRAVINQ